MMKSVHVDSPTYLELGLMHGEVQTINGKELSREGVRHVINYLCQETDVKAEAVLDKVNEMNTDCGAVTLKLFNGAVMAV